jgi:hypothetical protein
MITENNCTSCGYIYTREIYDLCKECFLRDNPDITELLSMKTRIASPPKPSIWRDLKKFSFYVLILLPIYAYVQCRFGIKIQLLVGASIILGQNIFNIVEWLMEKF